MSNNMESIKEKILSTSPYLEEMVKELTQTVFQQDDVFELIKNRTNEILKITVHEQNTQNLNPKDIIVKTVGKKTQSVVPDFRVNTPEALSEISKKAIFEILQIISPKYLTSVSEKIRNFSNTLPTDITNPSEFLSKITQQKMNEILKNIETPYTVLTLKNFQIKNAGIEKSLRFDLTLKLKPVRPFVKIILVVQTLRKQLLKIVFQIQGFVKLSDVNIGHMNKSYVINPGSLHAELTVSLKRIEIFNRLETPIKKGDVIKQIGHSEFKKVLPKIIISN